ncbi:MAG TPA: flagellar basal body rod C-terminal domain-containing protein [Candidatus Brocadiales bacterium]|nr:flagellar basal body rod C-terminal domain-containing protein [Candidatus Brocadiales bacterium]
MQNRRSEISGVSIDEELLNLVRFQRAYQASARFISVISDLTNTIFNI